MPDLEKLVSPAEGAAVVGVKPRTMRMWLAQDPPPFKYSRLSRRVIRFRLGDLLAWLESRSVGGEAV